ncbi:MAG: M48 family metallopeptidase [Cytophagales bacterium]
MNKLSAIYFDGKTSREYKVTVSFEKSTWFIHWHDEQVLSGILLAEWNIDEIDKSIISKEKITFKYGKFPYQVLEFIPQDVIPILEYNYPDLNLIQGQNFSTSKKTWKTILFSTLSLVSLVLIFYFLIVPFLIDNFVRNCPKEIEENIGSKVYETYMMSESKDSVLTDDLNNFSKNINFKTDYNLHFTVVNSSQVNAFALPGGEIVVYKGILEKINSPEQLAALLSHEVSHVTLRHSLKGIIRHFSTSILLSLLVGDSHGVTSFIAQQSDALVGLGYSRSLEQDADQEGFKLLKYNKIDADGFVGLFQILNKENHEHSLDISWMSTHPLTSDRLSYSKANKSKTARYSTPFELLNSYTVLKSHL